MSGAEVEGSFEVICRGVVMGWLRRIVCVLACARGRFVG